MYLCVADLYDVGLKVFTNEVVFKFVFILCSSAKIVSLVGRGAYLCAADVSVIGLKDI